MLPEIEPETLKADRKAPQRQCIACRKSLDKGRLIRFTAGPDGQVLPDLAGKLPGRGCWVLCDKQMVQQAIDKNLFARAAKQKLLLPDNLLELVEQGLLQRAKQAIALARKAGQAVAGADKIAALLLKNKVEMVVHASDAAQDGIRKLRGGPSVEHYQLLSRDSLSQLMGADNVVHVALLGEDAGRYAQKEILRFTGFLGNSPL